MASENKNNLSISNNDLSSSSEEDSDNDGSKDWEEILVGTDPKNPKDKPNSAKSVATADLTSAIPKGPVGANGLSNTNYDFRMVPGVPPMGSPFGIFRKKGIGFPWNTQMGWFFGGGCAQKR